jgi:hypothetical protein
MKQIFMSLPLALTISGGALAAERPNIVMFALDDLNDWIAALKLSIAGESFHWDLKQKNKAKGK